MSATSWKKKKRKTVLLLKTSWSKYSAWTLTSKSWKYKSATRNVLPGLKVFSAEIHKLADRNSPSKVPEKNVRIRVRQKNIGMPLRRISENPTAVCSQIKFAR